MGRPSELRSIGTPHGAGARLVDSGTVDVVFGLDDALALAQTVEVVVRRIVARRAVVAVPIAAKLSPLNIKIDDMINQILVPFILISSLFQVD